MSVAAAGPLPERRCVACGAPASTPFCTACGADVGGLRLPLVHASPDVDKLVHRLNWGAALLPGLWTFAHGAPVLGVMFWLFFLPLPPVSLGIMGYLLFNGNRVALQRRRFADPAQFVAVQRAWTIAGVIAVPFMLFALFVWIGVMASIAGSPEAPK
ncbi:MAG TPA: zinc ribbon domain-containing protein [Candidatus Elarobacter sp.]|nr:zinc ribbon domain-containing protein [Candidatus Elarobacter sp.]